MDTNLDGVVLSRVVRGEAERAPDRVCVVLENDDLPAVTLTAADLALRGNQLAAALHETGVPRGTPVALMAGNCAELLYALVANSQLGLPSVPVDPRTGPEMLADVLGRTECGAIVVEERLLADKAVATAIARSGAQPFVIGAPGKSEGPSLGPLLGEILAGPPAPDAGEHVDHLDAPWLLSVASGSGKDPRTLEVEHGRQLFFRQVPGHLGYRPDDVAYTALPITTGNALIGTLLPALSGAIDRAVLSRRLSTARLWDLCIEHGVTTWSSYGEMASAVYNESSSDRDRAHGVRLVISTGMPREIWRAFEQRFGVRVLEWYGTLHGGFACNPAGVGPVGSFGKPPADLVMDVIDEAGEPVPAGSIGELILRPAGSPARVRYLKDPEASALAVRDGWLHTGDLVTRDANGWLYFVAHKNGTHGEDAELAPELATG
jgi:crotonobetaine/carnitine-CoA ligase